MKIRWLIFSLLVMLALVFAAVGVASYFQSMDLYYLGHRIAVGFHADWGLLALGLGRKVALVPGGIYFERHEPFAGSWFDGDYSFLGFGFRMDQIPYVRAPLAVLSVMTGIFAYWVWPGRKGRGNKGAFPVGGPATQSPAATAAGNSVRAQS